MNVIDDITEALEQYYKSKTNTINALNELHFKIFDNQKMVLIDLDEAIQEYAKDNDLCPNCGHTIKYDYKQKCINCLHCDYFRNM